MRVAINGFGRIGRSVFRANLLDPRIEIVAINDVADQAQSAHLLKYDTNYGVLKNDVKSGDGKLIVDGKEYILLSNRNPEDLPWGELEIDLVLECTGAFRTKEKAGLHIKAGAKKVMISAPAKDEVDLTAVYGVNHTDYNPETDHIVSNASCTTNCLAPLVKVLNDAFGIENGLMTTVHSYTTTQNILDNSHKDWRRGRTAASNMIPTSTGAAKALGLVIPELKGKLNGMAIRVPLPVVSLVDCVLNLKKEVTVEEVNAAVKAAAEGDMKGILGYSDLPLVSSDYKEDPRSSIFDALSTQVIDGKTIKVLAWYDNEWSYSNRCIDLAMYMDQQD
ncbi:MAG: glyceraldehyde 3-phosphate dehydrogenase [Oceanicoccus sp.]|jgi:glyceraldehyde 3-phosphate dehydrogenase